MYPVSNKITIEKTQSPVKPTISNVGQNIANLLEAASTSFLVGNNDEGDALLDAVGLLQREVKKPTTSES